MIKSKVVYILSLFCLAIGFAACNVASISTPEQQLSTHTQTVQNNVVSSIATDHIDGNIRFFLTDAPLDDVAEVNITVTELRVKRHVDDTATEDTADESTTDESTTDESTAAEGTSDEGTATEDEESDDSEWETITFDPARVIDLKKLADGLTDVLGDLNLPTGVYKEIRLHVTQSEVVLNDGTTETLKIPSGDSSGLKIKFKGEGVTIEQGKKYALVLDFDLAKSLIRKADKQHETGAGASHAGNESGSSSDESSATDDSADDSSTDSADSNEDTTSTDGASSTDGQEDTSTDGATSTDGDTSTEDGQADDSSENESVEGSTWILKPVIRVSYVAEVDETTASATVILTDE